MNRTFNPCIRDNDAVEDSFQAFRVEGAFFTNTEEYPIIPLKMVATEPPKKIMPFNKALTFQGDLSETFICSFSPDKTFERIRRNPKKYLRFFKRTAGIIGFDYSIHSDMPMIMQKSQIYDNLSLTYFYGTNGIPVIPNIRCGDDDLLPEFLEAIPKKSMIAIGTHGFCKEMREKYEWYCFLETVITRLNPTTVVVYGSLNGKIFDDFKDHTNFIFYDPWIKQRYREVKRNGN